LVEPFYSQVEHGSPIAGWVVALLMKVYFSLYFYDHYDGLYVVYRVVISFIFISLLCWLCICFITEVMYASHRVFACKQMKNVYIT